ncbi:PREDICTED: HLA class II histocompatibility antigen, DM alpha chain-like [Elephantulus edwardii]|uniref:HLA class II histocompatibility antigen, DM alpha chain-like n=1 Tax=Elephantulus edwardii TaxID=28737 RepID=UPI0003F0CC13|nr:PREDICTED: HLA class II histocompatibility antigen, DM alpha chain-like [Elephantulus edwardii]
MDHEQNQGAVLLVLLQFLCLLPHSWATPEAPTTVWKDNLQNHTFLHTVYCQDGYPSLGLSESYDEDQLFSYDFSQNTRLPRLAEFADWAKDEGDASAISFDKEFCQGMIQQIGPRLVGEIPVSRGFPVVEVFTLKPLEFGKPNTLVCFVSNLFPPTLSVSWQHHSVSLEGVGHTFVSSNDELSFQAFSYLNFTPEPFDLFSCIVTHEIDRYTAIAFWVPQNALPSDLLENVLCGVAFGLGLLGIIVGTILIIYFRRPCSRGMLKHWKGVSEPWELDTVLYMEEDRLFRGMGEDIK